MTYTIVGLGNKGDEYRATRHNVGRIMLEKLRKKFGFSEWEPESKDEKKNKFLYAKGHIGKHSVTLVLPELFMNKSGVSIAPLITSKKKAENLVVVYDDIDLGFHDHKISYGRSSGGHRGIESIIKSLKTKDFVRVRIGIAPTTSSGKVQKPKGEEKVLQFLMGDFGKKEVEAFPIISRTINEIIETIVTEGRIPAMNAHN
ncbi:MAG: aminoacyl-tRNA hydrolase [Candidatus Paceibacterota bacterium]